jgi:putative transposase
MARPLRIERTGVWYHVSGRGIERRKIFMDARDRRHWLELLGETAGMFRVVVHGYVQMDNHFHLIVELREPNLSRAMHWLNVSYTVWFNRRHKRVGPLFQGRYKAVLADPVGWGLEVSRYVHLNPVRIKVLGLGKGERKADRIGAGAQPASAIVKERIARLREYRWSSYRPYVGLEAGPEWLECGRVLELIGRGTAKERRRAYQLHVESAVRQGLEESPWEQLKGQFVLGGKELLEGLRRSVAGKRREQPQARSLVVRPAFDDLVKAVERARGQKWERFRDGYGDWGRDLVLYLGRRECGLKLKELGKSAGGMDYAAVSVAVKRFERRLARDSRLRCVIDEIRKQIVEC